MAGVRRGFLVAAASAFSSAALAQAPHVAVITNPDWVVKPTTDDMARFYPPFPRVLNLEGRVMLKCAVDQFGTVRDCTVLSESPVGMGFGRAAVNMSASFRMKPKTVDGVAVSGAEISVPIAFSFGGDDPPPPDPPVLFDKPTAEALALG